MGKKTVFFDKHRQARAKIVDFSGWEMPLHYGSQGAEHHMVRKAWGVFDVSHMGIVDCSGAGAEDFLRRLLANDVARLTTVGRALYGVMLNPEGGVIDDLIVYRTGLDAFRVIVNAGTRDGDLAWMRARADGFDVEILERLDLALLAVQGPETSTRLTPLLPANLRGKTVGLQPFHAVHSAEVMAARTGYTGEDGFEIMGPVGEILGLWDRLLESGCPPVGLGARDTLRLEAGLNLYGSDMDARFNPLESGLGWTIAWDPPERDFIGRSALEPLRNEPPPLKRVGLILEQKGVLRDHQTVLDEAGPVGEITSGGFSPTLEKGIALARVARRIKPGEGCWVDMRGRLLPVRVVTPPFVKFGRPVAA